MKKEINMLEVSRIVAVLKEQSLKSYRNLESINTGSFHKDKAEIVQSVCDQARESRRINSTLHDCLDWLMQGKSIANFYKYKIMMCDEYRPDSQDKKDTMRELEWITELIVKDIDI